MRKQRSQFYRFLKSALVFIFVAQTAFAVEMTAGEAQLAREKFVAAARDELDKPYEYGGVGPNNFDCSGLVYYVARTSIGVKLPRTSKGIYNDVRIISSAKKEIGDLLFFKLSDDGTISHVGIYIGNNEFISAVNDVEKSGVKISKLTSDYWSSRFVAAGQFLPSGKATDNAVQTEKKAEETAATETDTAATKVKKAEKSETAKETATKKKNKKSDDEVETVKEKTPKVKDNTIVTSGRKEGTVADKIIIDGTVFFDWSLLSPRQFVFRYRGIDALLHVRYAGWILEPGLGFDFRYNYGLNTIQMPIIVSATLNDYIRFYAGPVITFSDVDLIDTDKQIKASVFPGIVGVSITTPAYEFGASGFAIQGVQDISYTYYNNLDGSCLTFMESVAAGFVMYTGIRLTFPISAFGSGK